MSEVTPSGIDVYGSCVCRQVEGGAQGWGPDTGQYAHV